ncbi:hypothetical protein A946_02080 [Methylacidiphilum kamchatkense Kam1]|uniref:Uncharacterized protein n=1 Tax=Methylacidiphilum kamchatkense Kam1 TaxID=1202785 RepID=A0A0C1V6V5_9BACT|nr:hypothetical protein A946_02080 [Methylacidiphilum kamchatkense Kam1]QDQ42521.1 hypothetical protein kam1_1296 [Methylacidiphilum kamchatkense Kam1]
MRISPKGKKYALLINKDSYAPMQRKAYHEDIYIQEPAYYPLKAEKKTLGRTIIKTKLNMNILQEHGNMRIPRTYRLRQR